MRIFPLPYPRRVLFTEDPPHDTVAELTLAGARGETVTGVAAFRLEASLPRTEGVLANLSDFTGLADVRLQIAMPVPVRFPTQDAARTDGAYERTERECDFPCCLPDPLMPAQLTEDLAPHATYSLWITARITRDAPAGRYEGKLSIRVGRQKVVAQVALRVWDFELPEEPTLSSVNWLYTNQIAKLLDLKPLSEPWWSAIEEVARNMGEHRHDSVYTPALTPPAAPLTHEQAQLVRISHDPDNRYRFDFRHLDRWVDIFRRHGVAKIHLSHIAAPWGVMQSNGIWIDGEYHPPEPIVGTRFHELLRQWLPSVQSWADNRKLTGRVYQFLSEEPPLQNFDNYSTLLEWLRTLAPRLVWTETIAEREYASLLDVAIPRIDIYDQVRRELPDGPMWTFYAHHPVGQYSNRFIDTPLSVLRLGYWQCFSRKVTGLAHWGYNHWNDPYSGGKCDPFAQTHIGSYPAGDGFVVYPRVGAQYIPDDPAVRDSVRHETMRQGMQDHALFTLLAEEAPTSHEARALLDRLTEELAVTFNAPHPSGSAMERFRREVGEFLSGAE
jgi:hypothetical protein